MAGILEHFILVLTAQPAITNHSRISNCIVFESQIVKMQATSGFFQSDSFFYLQ